MSYEAFENLELIPRLLNEVVSLRKKVIDLENIITPEIHLIKKIDVARYLGKSYNSINNMIDDGRLKENIHYKKHIKDNKVKIEFITNAIIKDKDKF